MGNIRVNLYLDEEYHSVLSGEIGKQHISEFFRLVEEEFFNCPEYEGLSIKLRAREIATRARLKILEQRKITADQESFKEREIREAKEREMMIERAVVIEVRKQSFRKTNLPDFDDMYFTSETTRKNLVDEVAHACQIDLTWKDIDPFVRKTVRA